MSATREQDLLAELVTLLGADAVLPDAAARLVYAHDGSTLHPATPLAVVFPTSTAQVAAVVKAAAARGVPFVARGAGTGLSGGAMASRGGLVVSLQRMTAVLAVDAPNRRAIVQPGVANLAISRAVAAHGLYYAPDPSSQAVCTIGGNVAHNSGGPHTLKAGVTVNHVLGVELVLPDGRLVRLSSQGAGPDLLALLVGSEGTLGIVTEVTVRLMRRPAGVVTLLAAFPRVEQASRTVSAIIASGIVPSALELLDRTVLAALQAAFGFSFPDGAGALLLIEADGPLAGLDEESAALVACCREHGALSVAIARDAAERDQLWKARKRAFGALGRIARNYCTQDGVIPRTALPAVLARIEAIAAHHGLRVANVFHAGDGNLHPCLLFDDRDSRERAAVRAAGEEILQVCLDVGGSLSGEHGIGMEKRQAMARQFAPADLAFMAALKGAFDPAGLCNPDKILPTGGSCLEVPPRHRQIPA